MVLGSRGGGGGGVWTCGMRATVHVVERASQRTPGCTKLPAPQTAPDAWLCAATLKSEPYML